MRARGTSSASEPFFRRRPVRNEVKSGGDEPLFRPGAAPPFAGVRVAIVVAALVAPLGAHALPGTPVGSDPGAAPTAPSVGIDRVDAYRRAASFPELADAALADQARRLEVEPLDGERVEGGRSALTERVRREIPRDAASPTRRALLAVVGSYAAFDRTARTAYDGAGGVAPVATDRGSPGIDARPPPGSFVDEVPDLRELLAARRDLVGSALRLAEVISSRPSSEVALDRCPDFAFDLTGSDSIYEEDCRLIVDLGGDDLYRNNAGGGSNGSAAAVVDLAGNDRYGDPARPRSSGANGGGHGGAGLLVDAMGNDTYVAGSKGVNGGGHHLGLGLLLDATGDDRFLAGVGGDRRCSEGCEPGSRGVNGGGRWGAGLLVDGAGSDIYRAGVNLSCSGDCLIGILAVNGGGSAGTGAIVDAAGQDIYQAGVDLECRGRCLVAAGGANGAGFGGSGSIVDLLGDDRYEAGVNISADCDGCQFGAVGANGGAALGEGAILDGAGEDEYLVGVDVRAECQQSCEVGARGVNGGGFIGTGRILDAAGEDSYLAGTSVRATCRPDLNPCRVGAPASNGGTVLGEGRLEDLVGDDLYAVAAWSELDCVSEGAACGPGRLYVNGGADRGTGLLLDGGGFDAYRGPGGGSGQDRTVAPKGTAGAQIDLAPLPWGPSVSDGSILRLFR